MSWLLHIVLPGLQEVGMNGKKIVQIDFEKVAEMVESKNYSQCKYKVT